MMVYYNICVNTPIKKGILSFVNERHSCLVYGPRSGTETLRRRTEIFLKRTLKVGKGGLRRLCYSTG